MYNHIVIGIDQSYACTGISVFADGEMKIMRAIRFENCKNNSEKRDEIRKIISILLEKNMKKAQKITVIVEQIRHFSKGFVNIDYIRSVGALNACIVDVCYTYGVIVYSVDTRCWKSQVVKTSKKEKNNFGVPEEKWPTIKWCIKNGWENKLIFEIKTKRKSNSFERNGKRYEYNSDIADSAGIAMFGFIGNSKNLKVEK